MRGIFALPRDESFLENGASFVPGGVPFGGGFAQIANFSRKTALRAAEFPPPAFKFIKLKA